MITEKPLVSVIIPIYNAGKYIKETLVSITKQTYANIEIILVNDGSTDNSEKEIRTISDNRIRYFRRENRGTCAASNFGLSVSHGNYIKFFDADDIMDPLHIESQIQKMNGRTDVLVSCAWGRFYNDDISDIRIVPESVWKDMNSIDWLKTALSHRTDMMPAWLWLIPREIMTKVIGLDERLTLDNDFDFSIRLLLASKGVLFAKEAMVLYRSGNFRSLGSSNSEKAYKSALLSTQLGTSNLLKAENSLLMREICANRYQKWLHRMYPNFPGLIKQFEYEINSLGGSDFELEGGRVLRLLCKIFGWKLAKRIQLFFL